MGRAIAYLRCSTEEQADSRAGLEAQRTTILADAQRRDWEDLSFIEDAGFSGRDMKRPGIALALDALRDHKADTLVVAKLDRLSRSMLDFAAMMDRGAREGWSVVALDVNIDTTTPSGEVMANVIAAFSHYERRLISQRTRDALAAKKRAGQRLGRPQVIPAEVVARIVAHRTSGATLRAIVDGLNGDQVPTAMGRGRWYVSTVQSVLSRGTAPASLAAVGAQ